MMGDADAARPLLSSSLQQVLLEGSLDAVVLMDAAGCILYFNPAAERIFGCTRREVVGRPLADVIIPSGLRERHRQGLKRYLESGEGPVLRRRLELTATRADGSEFPVELTIDVANDAGGPTFIGSVRDITDRVVATQRLENLAELGSALARAQTTSDVANVTVARGMRAARADGCTLYVLDETGAVLDLIAEQGIPPEVVERIGRLTETSGVPAAFATVRSQQAIWAEDEAENRAVFPELAAIRAEGPRAKALWIMPLVVEGHPVGLLGMGFHRPRRFPPDERAFMETFTKHCAQALLRAARLDREREARRWLATTLRSVGDAVIATDTTERVVFMNHVAERLTGWSEAEARGLPLDCVFQTSDPAADRPARRVLREGGPPYTGSRLLRSRDNVEIPVDDSVAPIRDERGETFGLVVAFRDASEEKRAAARRAFLAEAGAVLSSVAQDYRETLSTVARQAVPSLADCCAIDLVEPGEQELRRVAITHVDPEKLAQVQQLRERYPRPVDAPSGPLHVLRTGVAELHTEITDAMLERAATDADHLRALRELRLESLMIVPLRGRTRTCGVMTFIYGGSGRSYRSDDLAFAEDFAHRAALAIENARALKDAHEARAQLASERAKLHSLIMQTPVSVAVFEGAEARHALVNDAYRRLVPGREIDGRAALEVFPELRGHPLMEALLQTYHTGQPRDCTDVRTPVRNPEGRVEERYFTSSFQPVRDEQGAVVGVLVVGIEVTDQVHARQTLEDTVRFSEQFIGMLGHDLRNPLNAIIMATKLLGRTEGEAQRRPAERIASSAARMSNMVAQLLDLTRSRLAGGIAVDRKPIMLDDVVNNVVDEVQQVHPTRKIRCSLAPGVRGEWDPERLAQVVSNLVGNGLQHADPSMPIDVRLAARAEEATLEVRTYGAPIPPELLSVIFDPYRNVHARGEKSKGLGLGLFISRQIVGAHGGSIEARSNAEEGTTFTVRLPRSVGARLAESRA